MRARLAGGYLREEDGSVTLLALYFFVISLMLGGLAIDFLHRTSEQTKLQAATDNVAHAAMLMRLTRPADDARGAAMTLVPGNLPEALHGEAIVVTDIEFGNWDHDAGSFAPDPQSNDAVRVIARRDTSRDNIVTNMLLQVIGYRGFEIDTTAIFQVWEPGCFKNGFVARNVVDVQSNNEFGPEFCMHGNDHVELNNHNYFATGAVVSMPDQGDIVVPPAGWESNDGLAEALRNAFYLFKVLDAVPETITKLETNDPQVAPGYVHGSAAVLLTDRRVDPENFEAGRVHSYSCTGNQGMTFAPGLYSEFVLVTDCDISFRNGVVLEDVVIATASTGDRSFDAPNGLTLGRNDHCAPGGGAALLTQGGFNVAANLQIYGSQVVALKSIDFAAQAQGVEGVSMISGEDVNTTSNIAMNGCPESGMDLVLWERVVRMVE